jgi:hypothetical protein
MHQEQSGNPGSFFAAPMMEDMELRHWHETEDRIARFFLVQTYLKACLHEQ